MTHRTIGAALTAMAMVVVASCGGGDAAPTTTEAVVSTTVPGATSETTQPEQATPIELTGSVTMWSYPMIEESAQRAFWDDLISRFQETYPGVDVTVEVNPWADRAQHLVTAVAGGVGPDVVYVIPDQIPPFVESGIIQPLDDFFTDEALDDYYSSAIESVTYQDHVYTMPILQTVVTVLYNKSVLDAAGVEDLPASWADLQELAPVLKEAGFYTTTYYGDLDATLNLNFYIWLWQAGGSVFSEDGAEIAFNGPEGVEALTFLVELAENEYIPSEPLSIAVPIAESATGRGEAAFAYGTEVQQIAPLWGDENVLVGTPFMNREQVTFGTIGGWGLLKDSQNVDAAVAWMQFITSAEIMKEFSLASSFYPARSSLAGLFAENPLLTAQEESLQYTTAGELHPNSREVMAVLAPEIQAALLGFKSPTEALNDAAKQANLLLAP